MNIKAHIREEIINLDYSKIKKIYIQGICGTAMSGVAKILKDNEKIVFGSDNNIYSPIKEMLEEMKIEIFKGFSEKNLEKNPELVIVGNIMSKDHPESIAVREKNIPYISFPELFKSYYLKDKIPIVIAGTNGKTTTTALLSHCLQFLGEDPSFFIGGIPLNFNSNAKLGKGRYFVLEGDEYETAYFEKTPKFWHFDPILTIITSFAYDHIDFFPTYKDYKNAFLYFINLISNKENIFICLDNSKDLFEIVKNKKIKTYGFSKKAIFKISKILNTNMDGSIYITNWKNEKIKIKIPIWGKQNIRNSFGVFCLLKKLGFKNEEIIDSFLSFKGVKRRQEILYKDGNYILIDDFAHHPDAVFITLQSIKKHLKDFKIIAIFEPRTNTSRTSFFQKKYSKSFKYSDEVIILPPPPPKGDHRPLNLQDLINQIKREGKDTFSGINSEETLNYIRKTLKPKTAIVTLSNGPMDGLPQKLLSTFF